VEQGQNFFDISDVTHQNGWTKSYGTGDIFLLHDAITEKGRRPIITGRANTMGGGGSINYTMVHESSEWLSENIGRDTEYWNELKEQLNSKLNLPDPFATQTSFSKFIKTKANASGYADPEEAHLTKNVPSVNDDFESYDSNEAKQLYVFPTQFNDFGQRTNSGVSIVDWKQLDIRCNRKVVALDMDTDLACTQVRAVNTSTKKIETYKLKKGGNVILACGSQSPRLLMGTPLTKTNPMIGKRVNDHICMCLGLYVINDEKYADSITAKDVYQPLLGTMTVRPSSQDLSVVNLDFFTGSLGRLSYMASSLYLAYVPFNGLKRIMGRFPSLFTWLSNIVRILITVLAGVYTFLNRVLFGCTQNALDCKLTTSLIKFNSVLEGHYSKCGEKIILRFFEDEKDSIIAEEAIKKNMDFLNSIGKRPPLLFRWIFQFITKIPYEKDQVKKYVKNFSKYTLLSEQHLAGGCVFGDVLDQGVHDAQQTGKVKGSANIFVADLSAVPLPRVSTQMTAYLIGYHVGKNFCKQ